MFDQYQTIVPQDLYQPVGILSTIVGLLLVAYLFMYFFLKFYLVIKSHTKLNKDLLIWKSLLPYFHLVLFRLGFFYWPLV